MVEIRSISSPSLPGSSWARPKRLSRMPFRRGLSASMASSARSMRVPTSNCLALARIVYQRAGPGTQKQLTIV